MKLPDDKSAGSSGMMPASAVPDERETGLPLLRTWRAVYTCVLVVFAVWIGLLIALSRMFS